MTLPNFIIVGAKKSATTSLYNYLKQHPDIYMSPLKEPKFFAYDANDPAHRARAARNFPITDLDSYLQLFDDVKNEKAIGEASPNYIHSAFAAANIHRTIPDAKLIVCLRNPVDRAYSNYLMNVREGTESRDIERAFSDNERWVKGSLYYEDLNCYLKLFGKPQLKVVLFENLKQHPRRVLKELFEFLGVDSRFEPDISVHHNAGGEYKSKVLQFIVKTYKNNRRLRSWLKAILPARIRQRWTRIRNNNLVEPPSLPENVREQLSQYYLPDIQRLQRLTGIDLNIWMKDYS